MLNLISNAIQHTPAVGTISITFQESDQTVEFSVENEGTPIGEADLSKIWLPFYRTEKSRNKEFGGTGLGLTITSKILDLHQSHYGVENTANGVRFYFWLQKSASQ